MDYRALQFREFSALPERVRNLLTPYFGASAESDAADRWQTLTTDHDDQAAACLSVLSALARVHIRAGANEVVAIDLIQEVHLLGGDRLYARLTSPAFDAWRSSGGHFRIQLANGEIETGQVRFNHGGFGGSLHSGFDIQGITSNTQIPRLQWNYRLCDGLADIDLDGYAPANFLQHLTYANSDPRQWHEKYVKKFGDAGYAVQKVGNVPELKVEDQSTCPRADARLRPDEQANALETVTRLSRALAETDDFRLATDAVGGTRVDTVLRDVALSPLVPEVSADALLDAPDEDLVGYYAARVDVERLVRTRRLSPVAATGAVDAAMPRTARTDQQSSITSAAQLSAARRVLENVADTARQQPASSDQSRSLDVATPPSPIRAWLSTDDNVAYGFPAGTRFVAAETADLQLLLAPRAGGYDVLLAVPRSKG
jgi:hypothetical protein